MALYFWDVSEKVLYVIVGPTAVGKTAIAIRLAKYFGTEVISADSRQVYKEMEIGTAKPSQEELRQVTHHFINSHSIEEELNAGSYEREAELLINSLFEKHPVLVLVGGSGLYVKALLEGLDVIPRVPNDVRFELEQQFQKLGLAWLQQQLVFHDPEMAGHLDFENPHRLIRALEVKLHTGQSIRSYRGLKKKEHAYKIIKIGLRMERSILYERIDKRVDKMLAMGLRQEAENLFPKKHFNALQTVGYQEIFDFLEGKYAWEEAVRLIKRNSRHYAKRQLTWFGSDNGICWMDGELMPEILVETILQLNKKGI